MNRQNADIESYRRDEQLSLPSDLDFAAIAGLSGELQTKLTRLRPRTLGHAQRIEGMTPAALTLLAARAKRG
jgi:tRNA uridine 5-carboxymethylaminomethyl modification enzyme